MAVSQVFAAEPRDGTPEHLPRVPIGPLGSGQRNFPFTETRSSVRFLIVGSFYCVPHRLPVGQWQVLNPPAQTSCDFSDTNRLKITSRLQQHLQMAKLLHAILSFAIVVILRNAIDTN